MLPEKQLTAGQFSSHSPHQRNGDVGNFLYRDDHGDAVIFEASGPGRITNIWGTVIDSFSVLKFYFDGELQPRYAINAIDFYNGKHESFPPPLVSYERRGYYIEDAFAGNSFAPVYFDKSLKISLEGKPTFYHVLYEKRPEGYKWTAPEKNSQLAYLTSVLSNKNIRSDANGKQVIKKLSLPGGTGADIIRVEGHGSIQEMIIEADTSSAFLQDVYLQMIWDDAAFGQKETAPGPVYEMNQNSRIYQVMAPIGYFFGSPHHVTELQSLPVSIESVNGRMKLHCRFPMPFWRNARITLMNRSGKDYKNIHAFVNIDSAEYPESRTGYFTTYYRNGITEYGRDWLFCEAQGTGWFLGVVQSSRLEHYCEGNEHFYLDGNSTPQINGTGTEDYYLGCFWPNRKYNTPFAGCVDDVRLLSGGDPKKYLAIFKEDYLVPAVYYRFHLDMPVPFYASVNARIQHGAESNIQSEYGTLAYLYLKNNPVLTETDFLDVGNVASRKLHHYQAAGTEKSLTAHYEGNDLYTAITDIGLEHKSELSFTAVIAKTNKGVRLRRRTDQSQYQQKARVYVNGKYAGIWSDPQTNKFLEWYDSEFELPANLTENSTSIKIRIVMEKNFNFNDYEYRVLSHR